MKGKIEKRKGKVEPVEEETKSIPPKKKAPNTVTSNRLELLITIVGRKKTEYFVDLIQSFDVNMQAVMLAQGTANEKMLGYLGLVDTEKAVILSVIQEEKISDALHTLSEKFNTIKDGKGIAFTVPFTSVIGSLIYGFLSNDKRMVKGDKK